MKHVLSFLLLALFSNCLWSQDLIPFYHNIAKDWGYCTSAKEIKIFDEYEEAQPFHEGLAIVKKNGKYGVITSWGAIMTGFKYQKIYPFNEGFAAVVSNENKLGFINDHGGEMVPCIYDYSSSGKYHFSGGRALVSKDGKYGYLNTSGNPVIELKYNQGRDFADGCALVLDNDTYQFIDPIGNVISTLNGYSDFEDYSEGLIGAHKGKKCGFLTKFGKEAVPFNFTSVYKFNEGLAFVKKGKKQMFIDMTGSMVFELKGEEKYAAIFSNGLAAIEINDKEGYVNRQGKIVIPCQYDVARDFYKGYALVARNELSNSFGYDTFYGVIDTLGKLVLPLKYNIADIYTLPDNHLLPIYNKDTQAYSYVSLSGIDYADTYTQIVRKLPPPEPWKPKESEYTSYVVGDFEDFELTNQMAGERYRCSASLFGQYFRIIDIGNGKVRLEISVDSYKDGIVSDGYLYSYTATVDFLLSWGPIGFNWSKESDAFILSSPGASSEGSLVETAYGTYKPKARELDVTVTLKNGKFVNIRGKKI